MNGKLGTMQIFYSRLNKILNSIQKTDKLNELLNN